MDIYKIPTAKIKNKFYIKQNTKTICKKINSAEPFDSPPSSFLHHHTPCGHLSSSFLQHHTCCGYLPSSFVQHQTPRGHLRLYNPPRPLTAHIVPSSIVELLAHSYLYRPLRPLTVYPLPSSKIEFLADHLYLHKSPRLSNIQLLPSCNTKLYTQDDAVSLPN